MTSSTKIFSRLNRFSKIVRCWVETKRLDSSTRLRNSSLVITLFSVEVCNPETLINPDTKLLMNQSRGFNRKVSGRMIKPTLLAIFSGNAAPITFGVISLKIMMSNATTRVAIDRTRPLSPKICSAIPVTRIGRIVLMRLLEMSRTDSSESILFNNLSASAAPALPPLAIARRRWRLAESMLVSAMEKKPDSASKNRTRAT